MACKVCPVVTRIANGVIELLAFRHPSAGKQFVKGSIEHGEAALGAEIRELEEESGIRAADDFLDMGQARIGSTTWHVFAVRADTLQDAGSMRRRTITATSSRSSGILLPKTSIRSGTLISTRRSM